MVCTNIEIHKINDKRAPKKLLSTLKVKKKKKNNFLLNIFCIISTTSHHTNVDN